MPSAPLDTAIRPTGLKSPADDAHEGEPGQATGTGAQTALKDRAAPLIRCRQCLTGVARPQDAIHIHGAHEHTFANPHGIVYTIACFAEARGCGTVGHASPEFTWFAGFEWRVGVCAHCLTHLGWRFGGTSTSFWALILDHLIFPVED
jgi:hypothetical protein